MAKNTRDTRFRKVDVDANAEDAFQEEVLDDRSSLPFSEKEINELLSRKNQVDALKKVLQPAIQMKEDTVKTQVFELVYRVLSSFKPAEIEDGLKALDDAQVDLLMKYIYRSFERPLENGNSLMFSWHEKTFNRGKLGSIVRVITDRKKV